MDTLKKIAYERRLDVLEMIWASKSGHIGGSMSCMDILVTLYYEIMDTDKILKNAPDRDRFILSKGHCAEALYAVLADKGFFPKEDLKTFGKFDTALAEHPTKKIPGVEIATGALGHGLSIGVGMALGLKNTSSTIYVLMGDGELAEGSVWEAIMAANKYSLNNLIAIIDRNYLQISGETKDIMPLESLVGKFEYFGWPVLLCDAHNPERIIARIKEGRQGNAGPFALIAESIKGKGSSLMEYKTEWHHQIPNEAQYKQMKEDLRHGYQ
ncbi:MAG: transketolase [Defluviitaleaceae bacterium]|nr:transketolase [Defluviitaleaceae bacterium]